MPGQEVNKVDHNVTIEKVEVIPDKHGDHIAIYFNESGKTVKKQTKPWALLSAMRHYDEKYTTILTSDDNSPNSNTG